MSALHTSIAAPAAQMPSQFSEYAPNVSSLAQIVIIIWSDLQKNPVSKQYEKVL